MNVCIENMQASILCKSADDCGLHLFHQGFLLVSYGAIAKCW